MVETITQANQIQSLRGVHRMLRNFGYQRDVLDGCKAGDQIIKLENETDMLAPEAGECSVSGGAEIVVEVANLAARGYVQTPEDIEQSGFATSRWAEYHDEFASVQVQIDSAQGVHFHFAHPVYLGDAVDVKNRTL
jgi:hypothetical protein